MNITGEELDRVRAYFQQEALSHTALEDDLVDHCCSGIEELMEEQGHDFDMAFALMRQRLVPNGAREIEEDLKYLENYKPQKTMKKFVFASGYVSALCMLAGLVLIAMSFFQKENMKLDIDKASAEISLIAQRDYGNKMPPEKMEELYLARDVDRVKAVTSIRSNFIIGQQVLLFSVILFAFTLLPYKFYKRYQRALVEYADS